MAYQDGAFTTAIQTGPRKPAYPFGNAQIPDTYPVAYERDMMVLMASYSPQAATRASITNLILQSEAFGTTWTLSSATISSNTTANPNDGALTADSLLEAAANALHYVTQSFTYTATTYTFSVWVQGNGRTWTALEMADGTANRNCYFQLSGAGAVGTATNGAVGSIIAVGSWYRCTIVATCAAGAGSVTIYAATGNSSPTYLGVVTNGLYLWGADLKIASAPSAYIPTTTLARTGSAPNLEINEASDGSDPFAFLVSESEPSTQSLMGYFQRKYSRVPGSQVSYPGSIYIQLPSVPDTLTTAAAAYYIDATTYKSTQIGNGALYLTASSVSYGWLENNTFYGPLKRAAGIVTLATGGTFTLTYKTSTTGNIAFGATAATIQTALNALADVVTDGITFLGSINNLSSGLGLLQLAVSVGALNAPVTMNAGSLTPTAASTAFSMVAVGGTLCNIYIAARATITAHGFTSAPLMVLGSQSVFALLDTNHWTSIDSNTIAFDRNLLSSPTGAYADILAGQSARAYSPVTRLIGTKETDTFYLPGVTAGITTGADIPRATGLQTDKALIDAILTLTGFQTYRSEGPATWMGPIVSLKTVAINLDDVT